MKYGKRYEVMTNMLNNNQKRFCQEYIKLKMDGTNAYLKVYKNCKKEETARANASRLLTNANIQDYIKELQNKVEEKSIVSVSDIVNELMTIAFADRSKISKIVSKEIEIDKDKTLKTSCVEFMDTDLLSEKEKKVIASYKQTRNGVSVETYDKVKALELLGKYLGMFTETIKVENPKATEILSSISKQLGVKDE
jgi:phage terminase small subunit